MCECRPSHSVEELQEAVATNMQQFKLSGGLPLLLYSLVQTYGLDAVSSRFFAAF